jgi:hypothetical protein
MTRDEIAARLGWTRNDMVDVVEKIVQAAVDAEREKVAAWMIERGYATGHGDTIEDLLENLEWQAKEREREACAKVCEEATLKNWFAEDCVALIRERNNL